jgi:hypothetical protein
MKEGEISPLSGTKTIADHIVQLIRDYEHDQTRQQARLLRIGMKAISQLKNTSYYSKNSENDQKMQQQIVETSRQVIERLIRTGHHNEVEVYLKFGFIKEAYEALKNGKLAPSEDISKELLQPLVSLARAGNDDTSLLALAQMGVGLKELSDDVKARLATKAIEGLQDKALCQLVNDGCALHDKNGQSKLFLDAISYNLIDGVAAMLSRHVNVHSKDEKGNTGLHRALFLGNLDMVRLVQLHSNPHEKNNEGRTPLQALLYATEHNPELLQFHTSGLAPFLQQFFERSPNSFQGVFVGSEKLKPHLARMGGKSLFPPPGDLIELAFLMDDTEFFTTLLSEISSKDFHQSCKELLTRYPQESVMKFELSHWQLDERHFATGCQHFEPPAKDPETNPPLNRLLTLFDTLNLTDPHKEHYLDPTVYFTSARGKAPETKSPQETKKLLREDLETFIGRFASGKHFYGTPIDGKAELVEFFAQLSRMVKYIIATLEEKNDPAETQRVLHEIIAAAPLCGGRYQETILREYLKVCFGKKDETPEEAIFKSLAEFRFDLFDTIISQIPDNDAHDFTDARHNLGAKFGIPGYKQVEHFDDPYTRIHRHDKRIEEEFRKRYNPQAIVSYLIQAISQNADFGSQYRQLQTKFGAQRWNVDKYATILEQLPAIEATEDLEEKEALLMSIFEYHDIQRIEGRSYRECVLEDQRQDYLEHGVYDEAGKLRPQAMEFLLEQLGVFHSFFPKEAERELPPAPPEQQKDLPQGNLVQIPPELKTGEYLF